jgi:hypothetical protein
MPDSHDYSYLIVIHIFMLQEARCGHFGQLLVLASVDSYDPDSGLFAWMGEDTEWSLLLFEAAERIKASIPIRRAAKTVIVKEAGLNLRMLNELHRLSLCKKVLNEHSESSVEFQKRQRDRNIRT